MNNYLTSRCANCTRWCNDGYDYGCLSLNPYSCVYIQRTIIKNRTEVEKIMGRLINKAMNDRYRSSIASEIEPYEELANGIVKRAVEDYRKATADMRIAKQRLCDNPNDLRALERFNKSSRTLSDCDSFFRSEWFRILTTIDGDYLLRVLKEEAA